MTSPKRVLVVEDERICQAFVYSLLVGMGFESLVVSSGEEALAEFDRQFYHLVLMDVRLPGLDGNTVSRIIRRRSVETGGLVPIIGVSVCASSEDRKRSLKAGMNGYIAKPIERDVFMQTVNRCLGFDLAA